jgi:hypothetical protein
LNPLPAKSIATLGDSTEPLANFSTGSKIVYLVSLFGVVTDLLYGIMATPTFSKAYSVRRFLIIQHYQPLQAGFPSMMQNYIFDSS